MNTFTNYSSNHLKTIQSNEKSTLNSQERVGRSKSPIILTRNTSAGLRERHKQQVSHCLQEKRLNVKENKVEEGEGEEGNMIELLMKVEQIRQKERTSLKRDSDYLLNKIKPFKVANSQSKQKERSNEPQKVIKFQEMENASQDGMMKPSKQNEQSVTESKKTKQQEVDKLLQIWLGVDDSQQSTSQNEEEKNIRSKKQSPKQKQKQYDFDSLEDSETYMKMSTLLEEMQVNANEILPTSSTLQRSKENKGKLNLVHLDQDTIIEIQKQDQID